MKPRTTKPERGNPYYTRKVSGGYSGAIAGYPQDKDCDVLSNCVGYAYGRFNEIGGWGSCKYLLPVNAERFMQCRGGLEAGMEPREGACMVWQKGPTLLGADGAGHVAIVERVDSPTKVLTSESGYGNKPFWNATREKGRDGNWGAGAAYKFLGFIYNPAVPEGAPVEDEDMALLDELQKRTGRAPESVLAGLAALLDNGPDPAGLGAAAGAEFTEAVRLGVTDGTRPNAPATRAQVAIMALRAARKA